jgi:hypothetical protein
MGRAEWQEDDYVELTAVHKDLLTYIEQFWYVNKGKFPTPKALENWGKIFEFDFSKVQDLLQDVMPYLEYRGICVEDYTELLTSLQLSAANLVMNFADRRSSVAKLKALGVTPTQWAGWLKQEAFKNYVASRTGEILEENKHEAALGLVRQVEKGDTSAIKLFFEVTGQYKGSEEQTSNLKVVLARFFEILQLKIKDKLLLAEIADEFEAVMTSQTAAVRVIDSSAKTYNPDLTALETPAAPKRSYTKREPTKKEESIFDI